jgi:hypothetical protein
MHAPAAAAAVAAAEPESSAGSGSSTPRRRRESLQRWVPPLAWMVSSAAWHGSRVVRAAVWTALLCSKLVHHYTSPGLQQQHVSVLCMAQSLRI